MCIMLWPDTKIFAMTKNTALEHSTFILDLTQEILQLNTCYLLLLPFAMLTVWINSGQTRRF